MGIVLFSLIDLLMYARAFTLIELLVVVAIVALLISILVPSLKRARDQIRNVVCKSNLRQYHTAIYHYAQDHNGELLRYSIDAGWLPWGYIRWHDALDLYPDIKVESRKKMHCPKAKLGVDHNSTFMYAMNFWLIGKMFDKPNTHILLADAYHSFMGDSDPGWTFYPPWLSPVVHLFKNNSIQYRHEAWANILLSDSSVQAYFGKTHRQRRTTVGMGRGCGKEPPPVQD